MVGLIDPHANGVGISLSRRTLLKGIGAAGGALALGGTLAYAQDATPSAPATPPPDLARGGTLSWAYSQIPQKLDPVWTQALTDASVLSNIVEPLIRANADASAIEPAVADKWEVSDDGLTYTFHIRPGITFHNGNPVTPEDVIASLNRPKTMGVYMWSLAEVTGIDKVDDSTVKITLKSPVASFLARLAMVSNAIFPADLVTSAGQNEITAPIGTGPFSVGEWVANDHLTLSKFANYWQTAPDGQAYPYLDGISILQVVEPTTQVLQVQAGQLNGSSGAPYSQIPDLQKNSSGQLLLFPQQQVYFIVIQVTKPPFDDQSVRQALSMALDRQVFVDNVTSGSAVVANSFMPKSGLDWNPNATLPYDLDQAKQLVSQSKYPDGMKGIALQVPSGDQLGRDNAVIVQQMWSQIGFEVDIQETEGSTLSDAWYASNYQAISGYQWTNGMMDPEQIVNFFIVDPRMNTGYQPAQSTIDLVAKAGAELDPNARQQDYFQLQDIYNTDVGGTISLYYTPSVNYLTPNVKGFTRTPLGVPRWWETYLTQ